MNQLYRKIPLVKKILTVVAAVVFISGISGCKPMITKNSTAVSKATPNPVVTPTPNQGVYADLYIESLMARNYVGGVLEDAGSMETTEGFTRNLFHYRSEGLKLYGFINLPAGEGPFPVIVVVHGYIDPFEFTTVEYSSRYADALAEAGYIAIHPNLRGYEPSDSGENVFGTGDAIDVLNLVELVRQQAGSEGLLKTADAGRIGLWGHSMGGGIVMRALIVDEEIRAGLLYASINADEALNLAHFEWAGRENVNTDDVPHDTLKGISPRDFLEEINVPVAIFHGDMDEAVPVNWSRDLCAALKEMGKTVVCREFPDQPHTFQGEGDLQFIREMIAFFDAHVR